MGAFEDMPSYIATKSDYYTHVMDIPPQYGPGYFSDETARSRFAQQIDGRDGRSWTLPLAPLTTADSCQPIRPENDPGEKAARDEAAVKIVINHAAINAFALRGAGAPGKKQFQAPLADPYATPAMEYAEDMDILLRFVVQALLEGYTSVKPLAVQRDGSEIVRKKLTDSLIYFRDRIGVPRDMSYAAARQLRAHLNWVIDQVL